MSTRVQGQIWLWRMIFCTLPKLQMSSGHFADWHTDLVRRLNVHLDLIVACLYRCDIAYVIVLVKVTFLWCIVWIVFSEILLCYSSSICEQNIHITALCYIIRWQPVLSVMTLFWTSAGFLYKVSCWFFFLLFFIFFWGGGLGEHANIFNFNRNVSNLNKISCWVGFF